MVSIRVFSSSHSLVVAATVFPFQNIGWVIHSAESMKEFLSLVYLSVHVIFIGVATTDFDTHNKKRSKRNSVKTIQHAPHFMLILFPRFFISFRSFFFCILMMMRSYLCEILKRCILILCVHDSPFFGISSSFSSSACDFPLNLFFSYSTRWLMTIVIAID